MKYIFTTIIMLLFWLHTTTAQETTPKAPKQLGIRLNKERFGAGLSAQFNYPIIKNGKLFVGQSLGFTLAHPQYEITYFDSEYRGWESDMKFFDYKINYPLAGNYNLGIYYRTNTQKRVAFLMGFCYSMYLGEYSHSSTTNNFYNKFFLQSYSLYPKIGLIFKLSNKLQLNTDSGVGYSFNNITTYPRFMSEESIWFNFGINLMWNWNNKAKQ